MILVLAEVETTPEAVSALEAAFREMEQATRAEPGCHQYVFSQEISNRGKVRVTELWESMDALSAHFATPHMAAFNQAVAGQGPGSVTIKVHELGPELELPR